MKMSSQQLILMMKAVISEVFRDMFYLIPDDELEGEDPKDSYQSFSVRISRNEEFVSLSILLHPDLAAELGANLLGFDSEETTAEDIESSCLEITNMIAGNFINRLPENSSLMLGLPLTPAERPKPDLGGVELSFRKHRASIHLNGTIAGILEEA